jgi:hypothetical protein
MDATDRLAAAIFAAAKCSASGNHEPNGYLDQYAEFIQLMTDREAAAKKRISVSPELLEKARRRPK